MANEPETTEFDQKADQLEQSNTNVLGYSRKRFLATWLAVALLALMTGIALTLALRAADTNLQQTDDIARVANKTADQADQDTDDIVAYMRGEQGIPGVPGSNGQDGSPGLPGQGEVGPRGPQGQPGDQGNPGSMGANGPAGPQGLAGIAGPLGPAGSNGTIGEPGPKGDKGDEGARGAEGPTGPAGPQGLTGPAGASGSLNTTIALGQSASDPNEPKTAQATCPAGSRASGGGYALVPSDPGLIVTASSPVGNTGWNATVEELSLPAATNWQVIVFAVCVS